TDVEKDPDATIASPIIGIRLNLRLAGVPRKPSSALHAECGETLQMPAQLSYDRQLSNRGGLSGNEGCHLCRRQEQASIQRSLDAYGLSAHTLFPATRARGTRTLVWRSDFCLGMAQPRRNRLMRKEFLPSPH